MCFTDRMVKTKDAYYKVKGHFVMGNYSKHASIDFKASKRTITLENRLDLSGSDALTVPAELFFDNHGKWAKHPVIYLIDPLRNSHKTLMVMLPEGEYTSRHFTTNHEKFYEEAKELGLTEGTLVKGN